MKKHFRPTLWWMIHTTLDCVLPTQFSVIQTIHWNVGLSVFFFNFTKVFVIIVIYAYLIDISQGSVETHLQRGGICTNHIIANCLQSVPVKEFWKSVNNWRRCGQKYSGTFFVSPCVSITALFTFVVAIFGCCLERFTFKFQNGNSVHSFETNLKTYFFTRTSFSHSLAAFQISYITWIWCCINYIDYLCLQATRYNYTPEEKSALAELIGMVKSIQSEMFHLEPLLTRGIYFFIYRQLQDFMHCFLSEPLRKAEKRHKEVLKRYRHYAAAVVFCPMGRFSFAIDTILPFPVPAPWVVNNPWPPHLSPVASSVAFLLVFLFLSSLAVDLSTRFSPKNHDATHVPTTSSVYSSVYPWVLFSFQLLFALRHVFCALSKIS